MKNSSALKPVKDTASAEMGESYNNLSDLPYHSDAGT